MKSVASIDQPLLTRPAPVAVLAAAESRDCRVCVADQATACVPGTRDGRGGILLGARGTMVPTTALAATLGATLVGTALVAGGAGALNQWLERARDARMRRTANRALPSGRLTPAEAAFFGGGLVLLGTGILLVGTNLLAALTAVTTFVLYVFVYTPLKPWTTLNTVIGAIPGRIAAGDWLGSSDRPDRGRGVGLVPHRFSLAVSSFPRDRLDLP